MSILGSVTPATKILGKAWKPQVNVSRNRWWKEIRATPFVRRWGYRDDIRHQGLLPRHKDQEQYHELPIYTPRDKWCEKKALFGQNDYIDILGNGRLNPVQVGYDVPAWLRGYRGNEFQTLLRKQKLFSVGTYPEERPNKWGKIKARSDWLWYHLNYRKLVK